MNSLVKYLKDARLELKKVSWPSRQETINSTTLVIGASVAVAAFLGAADYGLNRLLEYLLQIF